MSRALAQSAQEDAGKATLAVSAPAVTESRQRLLFIDNLRWTMIVLVVMIHAAVTYSGLGSWYYREPARLGNGALLFFVFFETHLQAFFMGLLFLVAGYFVPGSFDRKGPGGFMAGRALRLGIPTLIYALLIHPGMLWGLYAAGGMPVAAPGRAYAHYILSLGFLSGTGPLWFALALLIFCGIYTLGRLLGIGWRPASPALPTHRHVAWLIALMAAGTFAVRIVQPIGTSIMNMQLCFFVQYVLLFTIGIVARRRDWLRRLPDRIAIIWFGLALSIGPVLWLALIVPAGIKGSFEPLAGGIHWQSAGYCLWESFFCVGMCLGLLALFREYLNGQGPLARLLSRSAFTVYVIHAPILLAISLGMRSWRFSPFQKFILLSAFALLASFAAAEVLLRLGSLLQSRRVPGRDYTAARSNG